MFEQPIGPVVSNYPSVSPLFDREQECAARHLRTQARILRTSSIRAVKLALSVASGALSPPRFVFLLDDGRALAWFGEHQPYIVHPSFDELCRMHGLGQALVRAA